jgi:hypothetical protein
MSEPQERKPYSYIAIKDGRYWVAMISASPGDNATKAQAEKWKKTVAMVVGNWIVDGYECRTAHSREEHGKIIDSLIMWSGEHRRDAAQDDLFGRLTEAPTEVVP